MKRFYILLIALFVALPFYAQSVYVEHSSGSEAVDFTALQKITFVNGKMNLHLNGGNINSYSLSDVDKVTNDYGLSLSVGAVEQKNELVGCVSSEQIAVNCPAGTNVEIFSVCGAKVLSLRLGSENGIVSISLLSKGVYILRADGRTAKFLKR
jgi:hypothetical protein